MADAALRIAMALPNFLQFPSLLRPPSMSGSTSISMAKPCNFLQFPALRSVPRRVVKVEAKRKGQVRLVSSAGTGFFYAQRRSSKKLSEKLELRKYDPRVRRHVVFSSTPVKSSSAKKGRQRTKRKSRSER